MFCATIKAKDYIRVKSKLSHRHVSVSIDAAFTERGERFYDIVVGEGEYNESIATLVEQYQVK
jgi:hypothetical protein